MLRHPLQLKRTALLELSLKTTEDLDPRNTGFTVTSAPLLQNSEDLRSWLLMFRLEVGPSEEGKKPPYQAMVLMGAEFAWRGPASEWKDVAKAVGVSGSSIVYGQTRELLLQLTGRGLHGPFQLPSVSFADFDPGEHPIVLEQPEAENEGAKAEPRASRATPRTSKRISKKK